MTQGASASRSAPRLSQAPTRRITIAAVVSTLLHAALFAAVILFARRAPILEEAPDKPVTVEMVMVEQKGAGQTTVQAPTQPDQPPSQAAPPPREVQKPEPPTPAAKETLPPDNTPSAEALPPVTPASAPTPPMPPTEARPQAPPATAPIINIGGTDSETNAIASGKDIIPASPDNKSRNRPPPYPESAARAAQQGTVVLLIHVTPDGLASGVALLQSSGHVLLDQAAEDAVMTWHFLPAVKDGQAIPFDMPMRFVFALQ